MSTGVYGSGYTERHLKRDGALPFNEYSIYERERNLQIQIYSFGDSQAKQSHRGDLHSSALQSKTFNYPKILCCDMQYSNRCPGFQSI